MWQEGARGSASHLGQCAVEGLKNLLHQPGAPEHPIASRAILERDRRVTPADQRWRVTFREGFAWEMVELHVQERPSRASQSSVICMPSITYLQTPHTVRSPPRCQRHRRMSQRRGAHGRAVPTATSEVPRESRSVQRLTPVAGGGASLRG